MIGCCLAGPLVVGLLGSAAIGSAWGLGAAAVFLGAVGAFLVVRSRRRRAAAAEPRRPMREDTA